MQPLTDECSNEEFPPAARLTLVAEVTPEAAASRLRMIGMVRSRTGEPLDGARIDWSYPGEDAIAVDVFSGSADTATDGSFDLHADAPTEHVEVVVSAPGHATLEVRLVPLSGLPAISVPIERSGRSPLAVRRGAGNDVECWCEFVLTPV
ncbi:peptidase associated/transthyretin-like domain-containing protein [Rhodococcus triatomae]|nr:dioxygenase [Rhodococcus triatomae BKS 15-14]